MLLSGGCLAESLRLGGNVILRMQRNGKDNIGQNHCAAGRVFDSTQGSSGLTICSLIV